MPEEGFRLLFDVYHMQLCVYVVQLTDSFQLYTFRFINVHDSFCKL